MKNASFNTKDVKKRCEDKLEVDFRRGKEFNGWYYVDDRKATRITIPKGRKPIPPKTYQSMARQLRLNISQFDDFLECPMDGQEYDRILREMI